MTIKLWDEIVAFHSDVSLIFINSTVTYLKPGFLIVRTVFESNAMKYTLTSDITCSKPMLL